MSAIEFAQKNKGQRIIIPRHALPPKLEVLEGYKVYGQIVGYAFADDDSVIVELEEIVYHKFCWPLHEAITLVIPRDAFYDPAQPMVMAVKYKHIVIPKKLSLGELRNPKPEPAQKPPKSYPSTCKVCGKPAWDNDKITVCSNKTCNSRPKLLKKLGVKYLKTKPVRCNFKQHGVLCGKIAVYVRRSGNTYGESFRFNCEDGHVFEVESRDLKINDTVLYTVGKHDHNDRIWNGKRWDIY